MGATDYSNMEQEILDAPQPFPIGRAKEVKARVTRIKLGTSEKNNDARFIMPYFDIPDEPLATEFNDFFWDPLDYRKIDPSQVARSKAKFSNFVKCFGIDLSKPIDWEAEVPGKEGWIITGNVQEDQGYGEKSTVSKYVTGPGSGQSKATSGNPGSSGSRDDDIPF